MKIGRRTFVASSLAVLPAVSEASEWQTFTPPEAALVISICDCIIPADHDPGALQAGAPNYIDIQLAGPLARFAPAYRKGLADFAKACEAATGSHFTDLSFERRTAFLVQVEKTALAGFFNMMIDHTMQGFYGSPEHGGNRGGASWKMLGLTKFMHEHS